MQKTKDQIVKELVLSSWWASWLPFGWMHTLAAWYYAGKARRIYANQKHDKISTTFISGTIPGTKELNGIIKDPIAGEI